MARTPRLTAREELAYDDRSVTYRRLSGDPPLTDDDLLLREIESMLRAAPADRQLRLVRTPTDEPEPGSSPGRPWSLNAKQRLRARNLLRRWARALNDPRHAWLAPTAPAQNYEALLELLCLIWLGEGLERTRIVDLLGETWTSFVGSAAKRGVIDRLEDDVSAEVVEGVSPESRSLAAGLAGAALADGDDWRTYVYAWQPFLSRMIELELFVFDDFARDVADALGATLDSASALENLLLERAVYVDEKAWGRRLAEEFELDQVSIIPHGGFKGVSLAIAVVGLKDPARDPRLIALARRALSFKESDDVLIDAEGERFLLRIGEPVVARLDGDMRESVVPLGRERLAAIEEQAGTLAEVLGVAS